MIKAAIIDDELHCIETLKMQLQKINPLIKIVANYTHPVTALSELRKMNLDIIFLDFAMPELNGFEFLKNLNRNDVSVIFTTAYSQYAIEAFKYSAFDYLLKPISDADLSETIARWEESNRAKNSFEQLNYLENFLYNADQSKDSIIVRGNGIYNIIKYNEIIYCKSDSNYTDFFLQNDKNYTTSKTLREIEKLLPQNQFIRIHKSYLINKNHIVSIIKKIDYSILMSNNILIPVSRQKHDFIKYFVAK